MRCDTCQNIDFQPLDAVQKLASSEAALSQTFGASLAISRKVVAAAASTKGLAGGVRNALDHLPSKVKSAISRPESLEVLHNSVYVHHSSLKSLELSAAAGCDFCRLLWGGLRSPLPNPAGEKRCISQDVRLYLSAYRQLGLEHSLCRITDQYIIVECGADRSMCLEIIEAATEPVERTSPSKKRHLMLKKAVRGFPSAKRNKDGSITFNSLAHVDLSKLDFGFGQGLGKTKYQKIDIRASNIGYNETVTLMNALTGPIENSTWKEGFEIAEDRHTGSKANIRRAITWLNICLQTHYLCTCTTDPYTQLPSRVIDLGPINESRVPYIYSSKGEHAHYATLSHRWAGESVLKTTKGNIGLHERCIPLHVLPPTFREAVEVCKELCVRYLWIDSLCIIQDSREDWEVESSKMGDYYWNSLLCIAADHASEQNQGCFRQRDPCSVQPCTILFKFPNDIDRARGIARVTPRIQEKEDWRYKDYSVLDTRSWVLQERILSPRTLFFGEHQLSFSCISMRASENVPEGRDRGGANVQAEFEEFQRTIRISAISAFVQGSTPTICINAQTSQVAMRIQPEVKIKVDPDFLRYMYDNWYALLQEYNNRSITQERDVLPALSGLAMRFQQIIGDTYLAGLWSGDLKAGLLWSVDGTVQRSATYRAPSWSWASLRTCRLYINYVHGNVTNTTLCEIYNVNVKYRGVNIFGEVDGGHLNIRGLLRQAIAIPPPNSTAFEELRAEKPDVDIRYKMSDIMFREIGDDISLEKGESPFLQDPATGEQLSTFEPDYHLVSGQQAVWCLPLVIQRSMFGIEAALSLVLKPNPLQERTWYRVGFARISKVGWFSDAESVDIVIV